MQVGVVEASCNCEWIPLPSCKPPCFINRVLKASRSVHTRTGLFFTLLVTLKALLRTRVGCKMAMYLLHQSGHAGQPSTSVAAPTLVTVCAHPQPQKILHMMYFCSSICMLIVFLPQYGKACRNSPTTTVPVCVSLLPAAMYVSVLL